MIQLLTRFGGICLCVLPVWLLLRRPWKRRAPREIALCLFVTYLAALLIMALEGSWAAPADMLRSARERLPALDRIQLRPFSTIGKQLSALPAEDPLTQLLGNTLLFMPWGFCLPLLWRRLRQPGRIVLLGLALTCFIEFTQLFINREVDVDDLILNFAGSMAGAGLWKACSRKFPALEGLAD